MLYEVITHRLDPLRLPVVRIARPGARDPDLVQIQVDAARIEIGDARVADGGEDSAEVGVGGEERRLDERRVRYCVGDATALSYNFV